MASDYNTLYSLRSSLMHYNRQIFVRPHTRRIPRRWGRVYPQRSTTRNACSTTRIMCLARPSVRLSRTAFELKNRKSVESQNWCRCSLGQE